MNILATFIGVTLFNVMILFSSSQSLATEKNIPLYLELNAGTTINSAQEKSNDLDFDKENIKHKHNPVYSIAIGYIYSSCLRFDLNATYIPEWKISTINNNENQVVNSNTSLSNLSTTINAYYDFYKFPSKNIIPYVTVGLGISHNKVSDVDKFIDNEFWGKYYGNSQYDFTWKLGGGITYVINDSLLLNLGYRFSDLGRVKTKSGYETTFIEDTNVLIQSRYKSEFKKLYSHQILLGLRINL